MATAPRSTAEWDTRVEPNLPTGVLTAATMTERIMSGTFLGPSLRSSAQVDRRRPDAREGAHADDDHDVAAGHRGGTLCAVDRRVSPTARHRYRRGGPTYGLLAGAHARGDVPTLRA